MTKSSGVKTGSSIGNRIIKRPGSADLLSGAILLLIYIAPYFIKNLGNPPVGLLILVFISFTIGYESHIRIKHIETIKYYRAKQTVRSL